MPDTNYAKMVKHRLIDMGKTQTWLFAEIKARTDLYCDWSYLKKISEGKEPGVRIVEAINEILGLGDANDG